MGLRLKHCVKSDDSGYDGYYGRDKRGKGQEDETRTDKATEAKVTDGNGESRAQLSRRRNAVGELAGWMVQGSISLLGGCSGNEHREDGWRTPA